MQAHLAVFGDSLHSGPAPKHQPTPSARDPWLVGQLGKLVCLAVCILFEGNFGKQAGAQTASFAGNAQHTANYAAPAQSLNRMRWSTSINLQNSGAFAHYGAPLITPSNTVLVPIRLTASAFQVSAFDGATGRLKYTLATDYLLPTYDWVPVYQPVLATSPSDLRLYYPGAGGTIYYISDPDSDAPGAPVQQCFYTNLAAYAANSNAFNSTVFINTPLTTDTNGVVYFGFRVQQAAPAPLNTTNSGFVRLDPAGNATYVFAGEAAGDIQITRDSHNCAPALSNDGATLYVAVKGTNANYAYLLGLDAATLTTKYRVLLLDPRNGSFAAVSDSSTASPVVGPDGDVFFGILANPNNGSRGFLLHFNADLHTQMPPSAFGWDFTPGIVPTNMVPGYTGPSSYLLASKYNNYANTGDGDGINRIALLDPNANQTDPHPTAAGLAEMREVLTVIGATPDSSPDLTNYHYAVREWCINTPAVNPATRSVFLPSEDGHLFRWDLAANSLSEAFTLNAGVGEPYVPTVVGPEGTIYTLNGGTLFALGNLSNVVVSVYSSAPDVRKSVAGQAITFTAVVTNLAGFGSAPTGTVTFQDRTFQGAAAITNTVAAFLALSNGVATVTSDALSAGSNSLGNHFITVIYSGDATHPAGSATLLQKVHASATITTVQSTIAPSNTVSFSATVAASPAGGGAPTGQVSFWDGATFLGQVPLKNNGVATFTRTNLSEGSHAISACYNSDIFFAASAGRVTATAPYLTGEILPGTGSFQMGFSNNVGTPFSVLGSAEVDLPLSNWSALGLATEFLPGQFRFLDPQATNNAQRFYRVRSP